MSERFHQPENFDCAQEGAGWKLYVGANDWEHAITWMACIFPGDSENKRVWVEINYQGHGNPDDGEVRYDGPEAKEAKAWGEKAEKTWVRTAKKIHSQKTEYGTTRSWMDAFKDALKDKAMAPFIKSSGTDRTKWEPMKESTALVAKLLEDDDVDRLTDQVAGNGYVVTATGSAGQKLYWVGPRDRYSSYAKDATVFPTPEAAHRSVGHYRLYDYKVEVWLGESEEADDFLDRIDQSSEHGFYVVCQGYYNPHSPEARAGQTSGRMLTWYWMDCDNEIGGKWILNPERASKYDTLAHAMDVQHLLTRDWPNYKIEIKTALPESEADEFLDRMDADKDDYVVVFQHDPKSQPCYLNANGHYMTYWDERTLCSHTEAVRRLIKNNTEYPTNAPHSKIMRRSDAWDLLRTWNREDNVGPRQESLTEAVYKRSSCQINAPDDIKDFLIQWGMLNIPEEKLYVEPDGGCGREDEPHVTVRYGLDFAEPPEEFHRLITTWKAFPIRLAGVSLFKNDKFDVVKMDVISEDLIRLNTEIRRQFPSREPDKFPDYHPHMTIAYVQKGTCDQLEGADPFKESMDVAPEFQADRLRFSGAGDTEKGDRVIQFIPFDKSKSNEERRAEELVAEALEDEADEFLDRLGYVIVQTMDGESGRRWKHYWNEAHGGWGIVEAATIYPTPAEAQAVLQKYLAAYVRPKSFTYAVELAPSTGHSGQRMRESDEEVDDLLGRMGERYYVLRFNVHLSPAPGQWSQHPPWHLMYAAESRGRFTGSRGSYTDDPAKAKRFAQFGDAWDARIHVAYQNQVQAQDVEVVAVIDGKPVARYPWPTMKGQPMGESEEADDYIARMQPCVLAIVPPSDADAFVEYLHEDGSWGDLKTAFVFMNRAEAAVPLKKWQAHFEQKYGGKQDLRVLDYEREMRRWGYRRMEIGESDEADYIKDMPVHFLVTFEPGYQAPMYYTEDNNRMWSEQKEDGKKYATKEEAWEHAKRLANRYKGAMPAIHVRQQLGESVQSNPFGPLNFPAEATEVLTKIRARRNKRGAPAWF